VRPEQQVNGGFATGKLWMRNSPNDGGNRDQGEVDLASRAREGIEADPGGVAADDREVDALATDARAGHARYSLARIIRIVAAASPDHAALA